MTACMIWLLRIVGASTAPTSMALTRPVEEPSTASEPEVESQSILNSVLLPKLGHREFVTP
jgi:hypothetical protein